MQEIAEKSAK